MTLQIWDLISEQQRTQQEIEEDGNI